MTDTLLSVIAALVIGVGLPCIMVALSAALGGPAPGTKAKEQQRKLLPFESGITQPVGTARERFSVKFYLVAMLFIVFDVEAVFLFPWAVNFRALGMQGLVEMFVFIAVLFAGFVYVVKKGALDWD